MKVIWSTSARGELLGLMGYLESRRAAVRLIVRIQRRVRLLTLHPLSGRMVPEFENPEVREVIVGAFRVIYRVADRVEVICVWHGVRPLPTGIAESETKYIFERAP